VQAAARRVTKRCAPVLDAEVDEGHAHALQLGGQGPVLLLEGHVELVREPAGVVLMEQGP
jgi:hypothetical protein